jgi:hypothetical protein
MTVAAAVLHAVCGRQFVVSDGRESCSEVCRSPETALVVHVL